MSHLSRHHHHRQEINRRQRHVLDFVPFEDHHDVLYSEICVSELSGVPICGVDCIAYIDLGDRRVDLHYTCLLLPSILSQGVWTLSFRLYVRLSSVLSETDLSTKR